MGVRILPTCLWAVFVNVTIVICTKERTGRRLQHIVIILIDAEILLHKVSRFHPQRPGDTFYIILIKYRTGGLAAIRAGKAIGFLKYLLVNGVEMVVYPTRIDPLQSFEKLRVFPLLLFGTDSKLIQVQMFNVLVK